MKARHLFALPVVLGLTLAPLAAHADGPAPTPGTIAVLGIDSDEVQDQADVLAEALKVRARKAPGWVLLDKSPSLGSLTTSLKCSAKPDGSCRAAHRRHAEERQVRVGRDEQGRRRRGGE